MLRHRENVFSYNDLQKLINAANYVEIRNAGIRPDNVFRATIITDTYFGNREVKNDVGLMCTIKDKEMIMHCEDLSRWTGMIHAEIGAKTEKAIAAINDIMRVAMQKENGVC